jgi:hypothetical protein
MRDWQHTMLGPLFVFSFTVATLIGAGFHLVFGGDARRLALFLLAAWIGFWLGHTAGQSFGFELFAIGELRIVPALIGALFTLVMVLIFTSERGQGRSSR